LASSGLIQLQVIIVIEAKLKSFLLNLMKRTVSAPVVCQLVDRISNASTGIAASHSGWKVESFR